MIFPWRWLEKKLVVFCFFCGLLCLLTSSVMSLQKWRKARSVALRVELHSEPFSFAGDLCRRRLSRPKLRPMISSNQTSLNPTLNMKMNRRTIKRNSRRGRAPDRRQDRALFTSEKTGKVAAVATFLCLITKATKNSFPSTLPPISTWPWDGRTPRGGGFSSVLTEKQTVFDEAATHLRYKKINPLKFLYVSQTCVTWPVVHKNHRLRSLRSDLNPDTRLPVRVSAVRLCVYVCVTQSNGSTPPRDPWH